MKVKRLWLVVLSVVLGCQGLHAQTDWSAQVPPTMNSLAYEDGQFVGVGSYSMIATSRNGRSWTYRKVGPDFTTYSDIAYQSGKWVATTTGGNVFVSLDARSWTQATTSVTEDLVRIAGFNGIFVASGAGGSLLTSPDAVIWTTRFSGGNNPKVGLAYGNGRYLAIGRTTATTLSSTDGATWTSNNATGLSMTCTGLAFGNGLYVASGEGGKIATSSDGISWLARVSNTTNDLNRIAFRDGQFVAVTDGGYAVTSPDGVTWTRRTTSTTNDLYSIARGNGRWIALDQGFEFSTPVVSSDAATWSTAARLVAPALAAATYGNGLYVAVGNSGTILTSSDGFIWTARTSGSTANLSTVIYAGNQFLAGGSLGEILTSPDGITWTHRVNQFSGAGATVGDIAYLNGRYLVNINSGSTLLSSVDAGVSWSFGGSIYQSSLAINGMVSDGSKFMAIGDRGETYTSTNGTSWTRVRTTTSLSSSGLAYGNGKFVICGSAGNMWTTTDGATWTPVTTNSTASFTSVNYGGGYFIACGMYGLTATSPDGVVWSVNEGKFTLPTYNGSCGGPGMLLAVGQQSSQGTIGASRIRTNYTYSAWRQDFFTPEEIALGAGTTPTDTPAGDGIANSLKYAFGLVPRDFAFPSSMLSQNSLVNDVDGKHPLLRYYRSHDAASNVLFRVEWTPSLISPNWQPLTNTTSILSSTSLTDFVQIQDPTPLDAAPRFLRIKVDFNGQLTQ